MTRMMVVPTSIITILTLSLEAQTTSAPAKAPSFEAASVKPNKSTDFRGLGFNFLPGGRFVATNVPLLIIIAVAYHLPIQSSRLSGGPEWLRSEKYDVEAVAEKDAIPNGTASVVRDEILRSMLQTLLAERFGLKVLRESKELPIYALVLAKNGPKLQASTLGEKECSDEPVSNTVGARCHQFGGGQGRGLHGHAVDMSDLVQFVGNWTDRPLVDKTGLTGLYDIETEGWAPLRQRPATGADPTAEDLAAADPTRPTLFMVLAKLGLRLESQKGPVDMFVIESVERLSEN
jgi:uncharacterized protein (TIGR03435 family)